MLEKSTGLVILRARRRLSRQRTGAVEGVLE